MLNIRNLTTYIFTFSLMLILFTLLHSTKNNIVHNMIKEIQLILPKESIHQENNYIDIDYGIFSDEMICDKVASIDFYPELSGFGEEANRRGIKCYYKTVGYYSTNNSKGFVSEIELPVSKP